MAKCDICSILENRALFKFIFEDELCFAILHEHPATPGHTLVIPKKHSPILEEVDDKTAEHLLVIANRISSAIFEVLGAQGTNIMINNGHAAGQELPHVVLNVLPRKENDALNLEWQPKKASDEEIKTVQSMIKNYSEYIFLGKDKLPEVKLTEEKKTEKISEKPGNDYIIKSLKRIP